MSVFGPVPRSAIGSVVGSVFGAGGFSPRSLFARAEVGAWYDPSDLTTLFQDDAGTTPVTTPGQRVALMLDKSRQTSFEGRRNLLTNTENFNTTTWTARLADGTLTHGVADPLGGTTASTLTSTGAQGRTSHNPSVAAVSGVPQVTSVWLRRRTGTGDVFVYTGSAGAGTTALVAVTSEWQRFTFAATPSWSGAWHPGVQLGTNGDAIDMWGWQFELGSTATAYQPVGASLPTAWTGNHATQSVLAQRPTYAVEPTTGRRNLLTYTEQFDNAEWLKLASGTGVAPVVTANQGTAPDGTTTADRVVLNRGAGTTSGDLSRLFRDTPDPASGLGTVSFYARSFDGVSSYSVRLWSGFAESTITVTPTWQRFSLVSLNTSINAQIGLRGDQNSQTADILVWGAQLELGSTATAYQRVVTAQDVSEAGVAARHYLFFDGIDDGMLTSTITPGVDKAQVFAGVRKLSDAARGTIAELTASAASNNGAFHLTAPNAASDTFAFESKGTALTDAVASGIAAPASRVLAGLGDIAGDTATLRVNGVQADQDTGDQGTGNYAAAALYLGRRGGASLPFSGHLYGAIVRFSSTNLGASQIAAAERWMAGKTGVSF